MASLIWLNVVVHAVPTAVFGLPSPELASAILLYLPLGFCAFWSAQRAGNLTTSNASRAFLLGALLMAVPFALRAIGPVRSPG